MKLLGYAQLLWLGHSLDANVPRLTTQQSRLWKLAFRGARMRKRNATQGCNPGCKIRVPVLVSTRAASHRRWRWKRSRSISQEIVAAPSLCALSLHAAKGGSIASSSERPQSPGGCSPRTEIRWRLSPIPELHHGSGDLTVRGRELRSCGEVSIAKWFNLPITGRQGNEGWETIVLQRKPASDRPVPR